MRLHDSCSVSTVYRILYCYNYTVEDNIWGSGCLFVSIWIRLTLLILDAGDANDMVLCVCKIFS